MQRKSRYIFSNGKTFGPFFATMRQNFIPQAKKEKLFAIMEMLKRECPSFQGRAFTDSAPVMEREWGVQAGLGWIGKNNFLISRRYGIKNLIGTIICNLDLPATMDFEPQKAKANLGSCGECNRCLEAMLYIGDKCTFVVICIDICANQIKV
mgnify:CR=1 FL=1